MSNCLGLYLNDNILRYAKLSMDNNKNVNVEQCGVRFVLSNKESLILEIIEQTNSQDADIIINTQDDRYVSSQMYDQAQSKNYVSDIMKMEFEAWCEKNAKSPEKYEYVYKVSELKNNENKKEAILNISEKVTMEGLRQFGQYKVTNVFPAPFLLENLVPEDDKDYILVNLDDELTITTVIGGKMAEFRAYKIGMTSILADFSVRLGSYQKAFEACKQMNVYTEGESMNDKALEGIIEPILQEVLKYVSMQVTKHRRDVSKVFLTGLGVVFTNIDILFREYLEIKCEILKPKFLTDTSNVRNIAEILETTSAVTLAYEGLTNENKKFGYFNSVAKIKNKFSNIFEKKEKVNNVPRAKKEKKAEDTVTDFTTDTPVNILGSLSIVFVLLVITYLGFSGLYTAKVDNIKKEINAKKEDVTAQIIEVNSDIKYVNSNMQKYKVINDQVAEIAAQIENNQISKYTTYNVASFLQNIIKVIPQNVQLNTISSDDNKNIVIKAQSSSYADLGYFVAQLKLDGVLNNVKVNGVKNGTTTIVEIGGELP